MSLTVGRHQCIVLEPGNGWFGEAGEKQTPYIRIPLKILDGPCEGDETVYQGWITDSAVERTVKNLKEVFGWDGDLTKLARQVNTGPFVGKLCSIVCEEDDYKGKKRIVIAWLNGPHAESMMEADRAMRLAEQLQRRLAGAAQQEQPRHRTRAADPEDQSPFEAPEPEL